MAAWHTDPASTRWPNESGLLSSTLSNRPTERRRGGLRRADAAGSACRSTCGRETGDSDDRRALRLGQPALPAAPARRRPPGRFSFVGGLSAACLALAQPGRVSPSEVPRSREAGTSQDLERARRARARLAVDDDVAVARNLVQTRGKRPERDERRAVDRAARELVRLADVDQRGVERRE